MRKLKEYAGRGAQRAVAIICLLCLIVSVGTITASAADTAKVTVTSCQAEPGSSASVDVMLNGNPGIWGLKLKIGYDHSALALKSVTAGSVFSESELIMSETLSKDPYVVVASCNKLENNTSNGTVVTLEFALSSNAEIKEYPVTVEIAQAINVDGEDVSVSSYAGNIAVVACMHSVKQWGTGEAAACEKSGTEVLTCNKCGTALDTRVIDATGHLHTEVRNAVDATKTAEGYTGDTYCKDCGKLINEGEKIAKLPDDSKPDDSKPNDSKPNDSKPDDSKPNDNKPTNNTPTNTKPTNDKPAEPEQVSQPVIKSGANAAFSKDSEEPLVFVSDADFSEFIRVEIDGSVLETKYYTAESGSTIVSVNADYLKTLKEGQHTLAIVSESGTASTKFTVKEEPTPPAESEPEETEPNVPETKPQPVEPEPSEQTGSNATVLIIIVVAAVLCVAGAVTVVLMKKRRG